ncbi:BNR repeat-containing family member [Lutibacter agarilyticus]|uniref:BNR repeat-containing family member n=1 Tax=Lutibacter agarilyticus TaxID=1109740 RepID=A0A238YLD7_9FLAO|nr:BNR repeat-containing protein [Lutibacter agarilyticus]SNR71219.1 BNR repeat-containing family member [Lutibacter agarilyticus]
MKNKWYLFFLFILLVVPLNAQVEIVQKSISTVDSKALTIDGKFGNAINGRTYQKDALASYNGYQYIAYYNSDRRVCISRRKLPSGDWKTIQFLDYDFKSDDSHNIVSFGICPNDGTIHLAFDHHVHPLHYRVSKKGLATNPETMEWSAASFGPIIDELEENKPIRITYPKFWQTPEGNLQMNYRVRGSGNGDRMLVDYNASTGKWDNTRQIDSAIGMFEDQLGKSETRCSYPNGYDYDANGRLHETFVWRENSQGANHDLMYVYSDDRGFTWKNNDGDLLTEIINVNSPGIVVQSIPRVLGLMNDHGQVIDSEGRVHVVMFHCTKETIEAVGSKLGATRWGPKAAQRYFHYWRDKSGKWNSLQLPMAVGNRPKIFTDKNDNLILIYCGTTNTKIKGRSGNDDGEDLIIAVATAKNNWKDWHIAHSVKGPFMNDMLADIYRWKNEGVLSVMLQEEPSALRKPSALRVVDLSINFNNN